MPEHITVSGETITVEDGPSAVTVVGNPAGQIPGPPAPIVVGTVPPVDADGRPDGTLYFMHES